MNWMEIPLFAFVALGAENVPLYRVGAAPWGGRSRRPGLTLVCAVCHPVRRGGNGVFRTDQPAAGAPHRCRIFFVR